MKFSILFALALGSALTVNALIIPEDVRSLSLPEDTFDQRDSLYADLERRKGGGGGGGGHASGGSSGGGSHSSGGSSEGSSSGSDSSGSSGSSGSSSSSGSRGGTSGSSVGTGTRPSYGSGGTYYGGGATTPYASGLRSPGGLLVGGLLSVAAIGLLFHGLWSYPVYYYPYTTPYTFYNVSAGANETIPVQCLCEQYQECGCDENTDPTYLSSILGNGSTTALNDTLVQVSTVNGTTTLLINGTLENATTVAEGNSSGAAGGISSGAAARAGGKAMGVVGWVVVGGAIACSLMAL